MGICRREAASEVEAAILGLGKIINSSFYRFHHTHILEGRVYTLILSFLVQLPEVKH